MGFLGQMFMLQPSSIIDALQQELWKATMADEFSALMRKKKKNMVLSVSTKWKKSNWMKWVFKVKENSYGTINKYKAKLIAKGFFIK